MPLVFHYTHVPTSLRSPIETAVYQLTEATQVKTVAVRRLQWEAAAIINGKPCDDVIVVNLYDENKRHLRKLYCPTARFQP